MKMDTTELVGFGRFISVLILSFGFEYASSSRDLALHKTAYQSSTYGSNDAGRAVDGTPGRDLGDGHCSHTGTGHTQAWWKVDLGQVYRIQTINITYRHDYTYRLSGYYLYVTNDTHMTQRNGGIDENVGYLCYHDHGPRYPSYNQSRTCPVTGRYVIIYNKRPSDFTPSEHSGYYSSTEAFIELCEVQVFGCPVGRFGDGCSFSCHCAEGGCDSDTGQCDVAGCQTGWKGPNCYVPLSDVAYGRTASQSSVNINNVFDADKAVDGNPGEDSCSHTYPNAWREAWWMVDLGQVHWINTVNIVFAHQHKLTISGYFLYVSSSRITLYNTRSLQTAQLCYHDTTATSDGPPPYRQSHQCSVSGQYVIVYNNRSSSLANSSLCYSPEDAVVELCDVQVLSCLTMTFGPNCSQICHCMSGGCDPVSGFCHNPGCQQGWTGDSCSTHECPSGYFGPDCTTECHCKTGRCDVVNGTCYIRGCQNGWEGDACNQECSPGYFGPGCSKICHCQRDGCNHIIGTCNYAGCQEGWRGQACDQKCSFGHFGPGCSKICHCQRDGCNHISGTCNHAGCQAGWSGQTCDQQCVAPTFGRDCNQTCHCAITGCDSMRGTCKIPGCTEGWIGDACSQECSFGHFGPGCLKVCHCQQAGCDHIHGKCDHAGCQAGWSGLACDHQCVSPSFGRDCNKTCHCAITECDSMRGTCKIPGCTEGWTTATCSQECDSHRFGRDCNQTCHCANSGCDRVTGTCTIPGCKEGWIGEACSQECPSGYFGLNCSKVCHCRHDGCDHVSGTCKPNGCQAGWSGQACDHQCVGTTFGHDCNLTCHCANPGCNRTNGVCNLPGCSEGWMGKSCSHECGSNIFGRDCNQTCHCANYGCDRMNGTCFIPGCKKGWTGHSCSHECSSGYFGSNCSELCHCQHQGCNHVDGRCDHDGCQAGWSGKACDQQCINDTFGQNCGESCHCADSGCDKVNGTCTIARCISGWSGDSCSQRLQASSSENSQGSTGLIGGVVAAIVAVFIVIVIVFIVVRKRRRSSKERPVDENYISSDNHASKNAAENVYVNIVTKNTRKKKPYEVKTQKVIETDIDEDEVIYVNGPNDEDVRGETKLFVADLKETVKAKHENEMYEVEFKSLPHGLKHQHNNAKLEQNLLRNRFKTTFPYDHSRVVLKKEKKGSTDYINANYIDGVRSQKTYIATQGPKTMTLDEFWRMAWQNNCGKIVMLANLVEVGKVKCATYWTGSEGNPLELGLFQVTLQEEVAYAFYTTRKLVVKNKQTNSTRQISQYHFTRWPDHGVPEPFELLQFYKRVKRDRTNHKGPLIVHCSAGIGRTGTFIGLDALLLEGNTSGEIDVFAYTEKMRKDRMNMIQTADQYAMLHDVLLDGLTVVTSSMSKTDFSRAVNDMCDKDIPEQQYSLLDSARPEYSTTEYGTAIENKEKNRNQSILAVKKYTIRLMTTATGYINAVNIPGYRIPYGYILTQHPLDSTVIDFLSLISQERSATVVSIGRLQNNPCWPTKQGSVAKFGNFVVTSVHCDHHAVGPKRVEERQLTIVNKEIGTDTKIALLETPSWGSSMPNSSFMLELIQIIQSRRGIDAPPVIITCSDGATESGLLCTLCNIMERLVVDGDVDIMAAARQLQIRRPQCFLNKDQYVFCYNLVKEHLEESSVYANV